MAASSPPPSSVRDPLQSPLATRYGGSRSQTVGAVYDESRMWTKVRIIKKLILKLKENKLHTRRNPSLVQTRRSPSMPFVSSTSPPSKFSSCRASPPAIFYPRSWTSKPRYPTAAFILGILRQLMRHAPIGIHRLGSVFVLHGIPENPPAYTDRLEGALALLEPGVVCPVAKSSSGYPR